MTNGTNLESINLWESSLDLTIDEKRIDINYKSCFIDIK